MNKAVIIGVDYDRSIDYKGFPDYGKEVPHAFYWLHRFLDLDCKLILWTCRYDGDDVGPTLTDAIKFCRKNGIEFWGINQNPHWSKSPKILCDIFIDDRAIGCPLVNMGTEALPRHIIDWTKMGPMVLTRLEELKKDTF